MIIFIYGEDSFCSRKKVKEIKNKFIKDVEMGTTSLNVLDGEKITLEKLNEVSASSSLFSNKRMIVIENIFTNKDKTIFIKIYNYLKKNKTDNIFVFFDEISGDKMGKNKLFNFLIQQKFVQKFQKLAGIQLNNWIKKKIVENGCSANFQTISMLVAYFESDLWQINNEINKLTSYVKKATDDKIITKEIIKKMSRGKVDTNIFALTDAISNKNKQQALNLFSQEIETGTAPAYLLHMITRQFRILLELKDGEEKGFTIQKIKKDFKMNPFVIRKGLTQTKKFQLKTLKNIFSSLIRIDKAIKQGKTDPKTALSILISRI